MYLLVIVVGFLLIPFAYFYGEERGVDIYDIDYIPITETEKICNALKYTLFFVGFIVVLLITGLIYRPG